MFDSGKIKELERKVSELEKLNEKYTLTNDIKELLKECIQSNEEFKKIIEKKVEENKYKQNMDKKSWWECSKCPISIIAYILLVWFMLLSMVDKIIEYKKTSIIPQTLVQSMPNAK